MEQLYSSIQVSILGIALVLGFFLIWRILRRIEERISSIPACKCSSDSCFRGGAPPPSLEIVRPTAAAPVVQPTAIHVPEPMFEEPLVIDQDILEMDTFFSIPASALHKMANTNAKAPKFTIEEEDIVEPEKATPAPVPDPVPQQDEPEKEKEKEDDAVSTTSTTIGRSKLQKMSVEALRDICSQYEISTEGTKKHLIERILQHEKK